jgi:hypothetical protein
MRTANPGFASGFDNGPTTFAPCHVDGFFRHSTFPPRSHFIPCDSLFGSDNTLRI